jgi:hypothetical protein
LSSGLDRHGAVAACRTHEFLDALAGLVFDPMTDREGGEHDCHVCLDGFAGVVVYRAGLQVVLGHAETAVTHVNRTKLRLAGNGG